MELGATLSEDRKYRYRLWRKWGANPLLMWIMLNPSTADETKDDPTIKRVIGFSINEGFGGCIVHNLFAYRATVPFTLLQVKDPVGPENNERIIQDACEHKVVCAWGNVYKTLLWRVEAVHKFLIDLDLNYLKMTAFGQPSHPLYLPSKLKLKPIPVLVREQPAGKKGERE